MKQITIYFNTEEELKDYQAIRKIAFKEESDYNKVIKRIISEFLKTKKQ